MNEFFTTDISYIVFRKCSASWRLSRHKFPFNDITYVIQGSARYTINGIDYDLSSGDLLYLPENSIREGVTFPDRAMHCFSIDFRLRNEKGEPVKLPFPIVSRIGNKRDIISMFHTLYYTWLHKQAGYIFKVHGLFLLILHRFYELIVTNSDSTAGDFRVKKVIRHIAEHYAEKPSVKKMAQLAGLNTSYFGSLFKKETGMSVNQYVTKTRIKNAENFLVSGEYRVEEVAAICGFSDVNHFYRHFKLIMGFPPSHCLPNRSDKARG
jgi:AraC-like DNA-binding protein